jgi:heme o synthase
LNSSNKIHQVSTALQYSKWGDYSLLIKTKLSITVVFTSALGYLVAAGQNYNLTQLVILSIGGFLITASANAINEVLEKEFDALMIRTSIRPLAAGRMKISEAVLFAGLSCLIGVSLLALINPLTAVMGMVSFVIYSFVYTPLKRYSTIAVSVGAIPGALPVLIGCTAFEGQFTYLSFGLFFIQFLWQFPHFWSIGFLGFDEYQKAGYKLLPVNNQNTIDRDLGKNATIYTLLIIPVLGMMFYFAEISGIVFLLNSLITLSFAYFGYKFSQTFERNSALKLMFFSFFYMPVILIISLIF